MNKKLIALAVAAGLAAPMAASAAPTVYGIMHMSVGAVESTSNDGVSTNDTDNWQIRSHASRLGFKGSEDLGGGMKAKYQIEYGIAPVDGTGSGISQRNQWVGLAGGFGEVRVGRHDTPLKMSQGKFDQFNDTDADIKGVYSMVRGEIRAPQTVAYISPKIAGGLTLAAAVIPGEGTTNNQAGDSIADSISIAAMYTAGNLHVGVAMDSYDDTKDASNTSSALANSNGFDSITRVTATYKMGAMQFGVLYETSDGWTATPGANADNDNDALGVSFGMKMGKNKLKVQYVTAEDGDGNTATGDNDKTQLSLGVDHSMSKNTTAYVMYTDAELDSPSANSDTEYSFLGLGLVHKF